MAKTVTVNELTKPSKALIGGVGKKDTRKGPSAVRQRWQALIRLIIQRNKAKRQHKLSLSNHSSLLHVHQPNQSQDLINEIKRSKRSQKFTGGDVFSILKSQATLTEKVFARQKISAKEALRRSIHHQAIPMTRSKSIGGVHVPINLHAISTNIHDYRIQQMYPITPEIQEKLDKIQEKKRQKKKKGGQKSKCTQFIYQILGASILGQTLLANPRFYSMDPLEHLPSLCRRCRRPLKNTLIKKFSPAGIIFALLVPIIGILLLFANQEFHCVVCEEHYVYGDLTARPDQDHDEDK